MTNLFFLLWTLAAAGPNDEALQKFSNRLESAHALLEDDRRKGRALLKELAEETRQYAESSPSKDIFFLLGRARFYLAKDEAADAALAKASGYDPTWAEPLYYRGLIDYYTSEWAKAEEHFREAMELDPEDPRFSFDLARTLRFGGQSEACVDALKHTLKLDPTHREAITMLTEALLELGRVDAAIQTYEEAREALPDDSRIAYSYGQTLQTLKRHEEALAQFAAALRIDRYHWRALTKIIQCFQALGKARERDEGIRQLNLLRNTGKIEALTTAGRYCRDQFHHEGCKVFAFEYFVLQGDYPKKYSFRVIPESTNVEKPFEISLGSYPERTRAMREAGDIDDGARAFHLDRYNADNSHVVYKQLKNEPTYDQVQTWVKQILSGELKALSDS